MEKLYFSKNYFLPQILLPFKPILTLPTWMIHWLSCRTIWNQRFRFGSPCIRVKQLIFENQPSTETEFCNPVQYRNPVLRFEKFRIFKGQKWAFLATLHAKINRLASYKNVSAFNNSQFTLSNIISLKNSPLKSDQIFI